MRGDASVGPDRDVEATEERAHRARLDDDDLAFEDRALSALVGVTREDDVELRDLAGDPPGNGQTGVGHGDHEVRALACLQRDHELAQAAHARRIEADHLSRRLALGGRWIRDADESNAHAGALEHDRGREEPLATGLVVEVVGDHLAAHATHQVAKAVGAIDDLPVAGDADIDAEGVEGLENCLALGPRGRARPLERVAAVDDERVLCGSALPVDGRSQARVPAHALEFWGLTGHELGVRLELRVSVRHVQEDDVT